MRIFSPWGHKIEPLPEKLDAFKTLEQIYALDDIAVPDGTRWPFLSRDFDREQGVGKHDGVTDEYDPVVTDPLVFRSEDEALKLLASVRSLFESVSNATDRVLGKSWEDVDVSDFVRANDADREYLSWLLSELDILKKFTLQRSTQPFWYLAVSAGKDMAPTGAQMATLCALKKFWASAARTGKARISTSDLADPLDTNPGAPFFQPDDRAYQGDLRWRLATLRVFAGFCLPTSEVRPLVSLAGSRLMVTERMAEILTERAAAHGLPPDALFAMALSRRAGPSRKQTPIWERVGASIIARRQIENLPRVRIVYMAPWALNLALSPFLRVSKAIRKGTFGWWFDEAGHARVYREFKELGTQSLTLESDVSALDQSMTASHRREIIKAWRDIGASVGLDVPFDSFVLALQHAAFPLILPDVWASDIGNRDRFGIIARPKVDAGLYSGLKITSEIDAAYVTWTTAHTLRVAGLISLDDISSGRWVHKYVFENQGDDVRVAFGTHADASAAYKVWEEVYASFGLKAKLAVGDRFLMKHRTRAFAAGPVLARILQQTVSKERPVKSIPIAVAGMAARTEGLSAVVSWLNSSESPFAKIGRSLFDGVRTILSGLTIGNTYRYIIDVDDDERRRIIAKNAAIMARADLESAVDVALADRFSLAGREMLAMLAASPEAMALLRDRDSRDERMYEYACKTIGIES